MSQEPRLFNLSIKENIRLGSLTATEEEIFSAAEKAGVIKFVRQLPQGLDTNVGIKGGFLSGGQNQRIAYARAILKNPKILLLDETTSSLDNKTEALIIETLKEIGVGRTTIIIAQRLKTVVHASFIYVFKQEEVIEQGSHEALLAQKGNYYGLYSRQNPFYGKEEIDIEAAIAAETIIQLRKASWLNKQAQQSPEKNQGHEEDHTPLKRQLDLVRSRVFPQHLRWVLLRREHYYVCREDGDDMLNDVYEAVLGRIVISLVIIVVFTLNNLTLSRVATNFTVRVRRMAFEAMLHYDQTYMDEKSDRASELTNILTLEAEKLYSMGLLIGIVLMVLTILVVGISIAIWHDWQLGIDFGAASPILAIGLARGFVQTGSLTSVDYQSNRSLAADVMLNVKQCTQPPGVLPAALHDQLLCPR
jgi:ABC-type multidrug transport system fused ATPase/permease subunit